RGRTAKAPDPRCTRSAFARTRGPTGSGSSLEPSHIDGAGFDLHAVRGHRMATGMVGLAGRDVEGPAVPWARDGRAGERSVAEGPAPVRADGVEREALAGHVENGPQMVKCDHER